MGENLHKLEKVKEVLKGDITAQFTDIIREAAADLDMDPAEIQVGLLFAAWIPHVKKREFLLENEKF
jgi:hypothetical protein